MKKSLTTFFIALIFCSWTYSQYEGDQLFNESFIHEIRLNSPISLEDLASIHQDFLFSDNSPYTMASALIDGIFIDSIGIRAKGGLSSLDSKSPLKLDFNVFVPGKRFDGLKKINLQQGNMESSFIREAISYHILRKAGVKSSRTSFAKVFVNDIYEGIYTIVEQVDDAFIKNRFASNDGTLYKYLHDELKIKFEIDHSLTWAQLTEIIKQTSDEDLHLILNDYLDVESFLRFFAVQIYIKAADSPLTNGNNYYLYFEPKSKKYIYIPWDLNLALFEGSGYHIFFDSNNFIFEKIKQNSILRQRFLDIFCLLFQYALREEFIQDKLDEYYDLLKDELPNDPYIDEIGDWSEGFRIVRDVFHSQYESLKTELESIIDICIPLEMPVAEGELVINEILTSNSDSSGINDPAGGSPDWVELYNNSNKSINLYQCYLSNDRDVLKHWKFPENTIIEPDQFLVIWADRDVDEEGLHADFKLNKSKGDLFLSFEDDRIIDQISYTDQETDIALARVPNGTGNFIQQEPTFLTYNNPISNSDIFKLVRKISITPNPVQSNAKLILETNVNGNLILIIRNINGNVVNRYNVKVNESRNQFVFDWSLLVEGFYFVEILDEDYKPIEILKMIKVK